MALYTTLNPRTRKDIVMETTSKLFQPLIGKLFIIAVIVLSTAALSGAQTSTAPGTAPVAATPDTAAIDAHYARMLRERLDIQEKLFGAMELYRDASRRVHVLDAQLVMLLQGRSGLEAIDLFARHHLRDIPLDLRAAYSLWERMTRDETQQLIIDYWIRAQLDSGIFNDLDAEIHNLENRRQLDRYVTQEDQDKFFELRARTQRILEESPIVGDSIQRGSEVIQMQRARWADRE